MMNESNYFCEICSKFLTGPIPYKQHLQSGKHYKKLLLVSDRQHLIKEAASNDQLVLKTETKNVDFSKSEKYLCAGTNCSNTGVLFNQETTNQNGEKELKEKCDERIVQLSKPEDPSLFTLSHEVIGDSISEGKVLDENIKFKLDYFVTKGFPNSFFVCKYCSVSFTGPECAKQHFKSPKHFKTIQRLTFIKNFKKSFTKYSAEESSNEVSEKRSDVETKKRTLEFIEQLSGDENNSEIPNEKPKTVMTQSQELKTLNHCTNVEISSSDCSEEQINKVNVHKYPGDIGAELKCEICNIPSFYDIKETLRHYESEEHISKIRTSMH
ncbi:uncharacterized protein LOC143229758 [Tachypleus tridentatus]|uniref:uncharacterized protein LOC143229758 n=1 Tax=Tachypleus tridentatus TaxID=6853 RepID=UPI003FD42FF0